MSPAFPVLFVFTYRSDHDASIEMRLALHLGPMQSIENLSGVGRESGEDFGAAAAHAHQADGRFGVCLCLGVEYEVDGIDLGFPS